MLGVIATLFDLFMGKNKKERSRKISPPRQAAPPPPPRKGILRVLQVLSPKGWFLTSVGLLLSFACSYFLLVSKVSVDADVSLDPKNAAATLFRFTNQGVLPVYDLNRGITVHYLRDSVTKGVIEDSFAEAPLPAPNVHELSSGESTTLSIPLPFSVGRGKYADADIQIDYSFKTFLTHHVCHNHVRFQAITGADGIVHWFHKAINQ
jgi:hypothetical protein